MKAAQFFHRWHLDSVFGIPILLLYSIISGIDAFSKDYKHLAIRINFLTDFSDNFVNYLLLVKEKYFFIIYSFMTFLECSLAWKALRNTILCNLTPRWQLSISLSLEDMNIFPTIKNS